VSQPKTQRSSPHTQIQVTRRVSADPTSAVLLLAAPGAAELWPGVTLETAAAGEQIDVRVVLPSEAAEQAGLPQPIQASIRSEAPVRTPTSYVIRFSFDASAVPSTDGTLTLTYARTDDDEGTATDADLVFSVADEPFATREFLCVLEDLARVFLANLATAAEERSRAA
jgi:hypothetical protein